ncbi:hypothetical protein [Pontibacter sp. SGAir0037]|uniref:hypothetical protein n=1 Tax=Pontibacter sp. SGAir0037 TaxID=2571030 RepID=UPI0010CD11FE|nr:hypothetical protein [Pontibacter sp. SGAir0037]QCR21560.1 hypothetical protein C1N53_03825 [Pontibacter sp. SGAir0037]
MNRILFYTGRIALGVALFLITSPLFAQNYEKEFEALFAWEVKQIDEFIERFNNTDKTLIQQYNRKQDPTKELDREKLIKSLFNAEDRSWNFSEINSFINKVNDNSQPIFLNFYDKDWYAKVDCAVSWKGKAEKATLILRIDRQANGASKWMITGVQANFLSTPASADFRMPASQDTTITLNPVSHATDFMSLDQALKDKTNLGNYFAKPAQRNAMLSVFMNECLQNRLTISKVNHISYHFLQVDDWVFEIKQFNRQTRNSGWLISKLIKASPEEKELYRAQVLRQ